jgi:hypothetical protein
MNSDEIRRIIARLKINAPDMRSASEHHLAALASYVGKLSHSLDCLQKAPNDAGAKHDASKQCGAALLVLASLAENFTLGLEAVIEAGEEELQSS